MSDHLVKFNAKRVVGKKIADRYCIIGEIGSGGMGKVYRAIDYDDPSKTVAIKVIERDRKLNSEDLLRFQKEAALMSRLHHPNIICFYELGLLGNDSDSGLNITGGYYIVMEIANGINLKQSLEKDGRKDLAFFFEVGLQVSAALDYTHGKNIIHRDIKPQNIIVGKSFQDDRGLQVKVLDFGVARLAEAMHFTTTDGALKEGFEDIAGTPLYMAPEQTPLMDATKDHRMDLYSLGCVLYELLAGRPPFTASNREKLERKHVYNAPDPLSSLRPDIPPIIEKIVHKLLAKHPDERYQTAFALQSDLMRVRRRLDRGQKPALIQFPLALNDRFQAVSAKLEVVGRNEEFQQLLESYNAAMQQKARSRLTVIRGEAGIGKTRLLAEFRKYLSKRKIRFISTSFSQHENALPFNALANGFNEYLMRVRKSQPHEAEELRRKIKTLLGSTAHLVASVVPGLKPFITDDPPENITVMEVSDYPEFAKAFSDFTRCLAIDNHPVVFIFDDLQWADDKSLDLIDQFFSHNNSKPFFMIVSHRNVPQMETRKFWQFIEKFRKLRRRFQEIEFTPFNRLATSQFIANMLSEKSILDTQLIDFLQEKTAGNPMHLVEYVRSLVARDLIHLRSKDGDWEYDIEAIKNTKLQIMTIDILLSTLQYLPKEYFQFLEIAAAVGLTFQFDLLRVEDQVADQSQKILSALQEAIDLGFVTRTPDDEQLKQLGKSYAFLHWRIRDAIYDHISQERKLLLHRKIAEKFATGLLSSSSNMVFAIAHHLNRAIDLNEDIDISFAKNIIHYNIAAGNAAWEVGSLYSAQRYFENAHRLMDKSQDKISNIHERALVVENLADLAALQKEHGTAVKKYRELLNLGLSKEMKASVSYKIAYFQMVGGYVSATLQFVFESLKSLGHKVPTASLANFLLCAVDFGIDLLSIKFSRNRLYNLMKWAFDLAKSEDIDLDRKYRDSKLYLIAQTVSLVQAPLRALVAHHLIFKLCLTKQAAPATILHVVGDRAIVLGYFGFAKFAHRILDKAMDSAKILGFRDTLGYLALQRAMVLDYARSKHEEVSSNLRLAMRSLSEYENRFWYSMSFTFRMFRDLLKGDIPAVYKTSQLIPDAIHTRNWVSPRAMAINFYAHLLTSARTLLVKQGETYLLRREVKGGRKNDLFILMIYTMVAFAKGEIDKARQYFIDTVEEYVKGTSYLFLYPFEEDFVGLFAYTFPVLFEQEHGRRLMRTEEMQRLFVKLDRRISKIKYKRQRAIPTMLRARSNELFGRLRVKDTYDLALSSAKTAGSQLVKVWCYIWFGRYLVQAGLKQRSEYLRRAYDIAIELKLTAVVTYAEKLMSRLDISFSKVALEPRLETKSSGSNLNGRVSRLIYEHLEHLCEVLQLDTFLEQNIDESMVIFKKYYHVNDMFCIIGEAGSSNQQVIYPKQHELSQQVTEYVKPYLFIRSTLFLPTADAPWSIAGGSSDYESSMVLTHPSQHVGLKEGSYTEIKESKHDQTMNDKTVVIDVVEPGRSSKAAAITAVPSEVSTPHSFSSRSGQTLKMNALIPIRVESENIGILFVEDIKFENNDSTSCRNELDHFGAQLGILIDRKTRRVLSQSFDKHITNLVYPVYSPASYVLEPVPWLCLWQHGRLRASRETGWYLGLKYIEDHYLLTYCRLNGPKDIRETISSMLWHHFLTLRSLATAAGRSSFDVAELKDDLSAILLATAQVKQLTAFSLAFTIFDRVKKTAISGHFGPSRPVVLGQQNLVTPENDVIMTFENGRDLRYWTVDAMLDGFHVYMLTHDSSKIEPQVQEVSSNVNSSTRNPDLRNLQRLISELIVPENIPRYYVAALLVDEHITQSDRLPIAQ